MTLPFATAELKYRSGISDHPVLCQQNRPILPFTLRLNAVMLGFGRVGYHAFLLANLPILTFHIA
jgi:hypothetical protein